MLYVFCYDAGMITACTVCIPGTESLTELMIKSLLLNSTQISKILVFQNGKGKKIKFSDPKIKYFSTKIFEKNISHALGLHECIDQAQTDYVLLTDSDIIYQQRNFDKHYLDIYEKYKLNIIGITHHLPHYQSYLRFPCVTSCIIRKDRLPETSFLKGKLKIRRYLLNSKQKLHDNYPVRNGKYLLQSPIPELKDEFPNPKGLYDAGCNLWLWNKERKGRWISFLQQGDPPREFEYMKNKDSYSNCYMRNYYSNFELDYNFGNSPLLLHSRLQGDFKLESMRTQYQLASLNHL